MVLYSIDISPREKVYFYIAVVAIALVYGITQLLGPTLTTVNDAIPANWLVGVSAPGAISIYLILVGLYDRVMWRWPIFAGLSATPDLQGVWQGEVVRGSDPTKPIAIAATVKQHWTKLSITIVGELTESHVVSAAFLLRAGDPELVYTYSILPRLISDQNQYGEGVQRLKVTGKGKAMRLEGRYFGSKLRGGSMKLTRE